MFLNSQLIKAKLVRVNVLAQHTRNITQQPTKPDAKNITHDYIGPVDPVSNLRQHVWRIPPRETVLQRKLREMRDAVEGSNHKFWKKHNESFYNERKSFIDAQKIATGADEVPADKMSEFYKQFLDKNHKRHIAYNKTWYKQNFQLLLLAFQVELENIVQKIKNK